MSRIAAGSLALAALLAARLPGHHPAARGDAGQAGAHLQRRLALGALGRHGHRDAPGGRGRLPGAGCETIEDELVLADFEVTSVDLRHRLGGGHRGGAGSSGTSSATRGAQHHGRAALGAPRRRLAGGQAPAHPRRALRAGHRTGGGARGARRRAGEAVTPDVARRKTTCARSAGTGAQVLAVSLGGEGRPAHDRARARGRAGDPRGAAAGRALLRHRAGLPAEPGLLRRGLPRGRGRARATRVFLASKTHERTPRPGAAPAGRFACAAGHRPAGPVADARPARPRRAGRASSARAARSRRRCAARADGRVRFIGLTGHHDPAILLEAMRRFPFDNVLVAINPADPRRLPFIPRWWPRRARRGMGVVGMKVLAAGPAARRPRRDGARADPLRRQPDRHRDHRLLDAWTRCAPTWRWPAASSPDDRRRDARRSSAATGAPRRTATTTSSGGSDLDTPALTV